LELNNMSAYLDTDAEMIGNLSIVEIRVRIFSKYIFNIFRQLITLF